MTQEEKDLVIKDLCGRLPYKVIVEIISYGQETQKPWVGELSCKDLDCFLHDVAYKSIKPYLRPISNMTEEEKEELRDTYTWLYSEYPFDDEDEDEEDVGCHPEPSAETYDWYNRKMFDYRGLIPKGQALSTEEYNPYKE